MNSSNGGYVVTMGESLLALVVILAILIALADTPLYPIAFGAVGIAALYALMEHPNIIPSKLVPWASSKLH